MRDVCVLLLREPVRCYDVFLFLFVFFKYFFKRPEITVLGSEVPGIKGLFGQLRIGQNGPRIWCQNATLDEMFVSGLALIAWTKCHKKCGYKIRYGQYVTNAGWMNSSPIFLWMI